VRNVYAVLPWGRGRLEQLLMHLRAKNINNKNLNSNPHSNKREEGGLKDIK